jgi:peptidoglycan L-alanyl-D-glutamate endopeptidase CwlK
MKLSQKSLDKLKGVHPDLVRVLERAAEIYGKTIIVTCGLRTIAEQKKLLAQKRTWTLNSRHLTGHAIDISPVCPDTGVISWELPLYYPLAKAMKQAAKELKIPITWGGDWKGKVDAPHYELSWKAYPINGEKTPPQPRKVQDLTKSRTVMGGGVALAVSGVEIAKELKNTTTELRDVQEQVKGAKAEFNEADYLGVGLSIVTIGAVLFMLYAKWTDSKSATDKLSEDE